MNERKEIIQLNGTTILIILAILANVFIVGIAYRYHEYRMFTVTRKMQQEYSQLLSRERAIKNEIVKLEGAANWKETMYGKEWKTITDSILEL